MNQRISNDFLNRENGENNKSGTIFILEGDIWGYNISIFNYYEEQEILLEPETKFIVNYIYSVNDLTFINCKVIESHNVLPEIENTVYDYIQNNNISNIMSINNRDSNNRIHENQNLRVRAGNYEINNNIIMSIINRDSNNRIHENQNLRVRDRNYENINAMRVNQNFNIRERNRENKEWRSNKFSQIGYKIINGDILGKDNYKLNKSPVKIRMPYKSPTNNNFKKNLIYLMQIGFERKLAQNVLSEVKGDLNLAIQFLSISNR